MGMIAEVGGIILKHSIEEERADFTGNNTVAIVERQQLLQEVIAVAFFHINTHNASNHASEGMSVGS